MKASINSCPLNRHINVRFVFQVLNIIILPCLTSEGLWITVYVLIAQEFIRELFKKNGKELTK